MFVPTLHSDLKKAGSAGKRHTKLPIRSFVGLGGFVVVVVVGDVVVVVVEVVDVVVAVGDVVGAVVVGGDVVVVVVVIVGVEVFVTALKVTGK